MHYYNKVAKIAIITLIISILLLFVLLILNINGINLQIGTPPNGISHKTLSNLIIIVSVVSLIYMLKDGNKGNCYWDRGVFYNNTTPPNLLIEAEYSKFSSPDNKDEFVVIERRYGRLWPQTP